MNILSGRHLPSGLSLLLSALRAFLRSRAQRRIGRPSLSCAPILANSGGNITPAPNSDSVPPFTSGTHSPEKLGLPSDVRGAGALRFGWPLGNRGTPAVG